MRPFFRLVWKEARELLRPRYVLPILLVPVMFVALGQGFGGIQEAVSGQSHVGIVNNDGGQYGAVVADTYNESADVVYYGSGVDPSTALNRTEDRGGSALIVVPENFSQAIGTGSRRGRVHLYSVVDSVSLTGVAASGKVEGILQVARHRITRAVTGATESQLDPIETAYTTYVKGARIEQAPSVLSSAFTSQFIFIPVIIMLVIVFSGQMVINSMGIEKENKTLETLLTMPVSRRTIVAAKLVGSASVGLVAAGVYTVALVQYQSGLSMGATTSLPAQFSLGLTDYLLVGVAIFFPISRRRFRSDVVRFDD